MPLVLESCSKLPATADGGTAWGSLDKEAIRRVIRANIGAVRTCYERTLGGGEALEGKIPLRFTIANDGAVCAARVEGSTLPDIALGNCIVRAATRWQFPPVNGDGVVLVTYPFIFRAGPGPGDAGTPL